MFKLLISLITYNYKPGKMNFNNIIIFFFLLKCQTNIIVGEIITRLNKN